MAFIEPLNLYEILVTRLSGTFIIFILLAIFVIALLAGKFKMPNIVFGGIVLVFVVFMATTTELGIGTELWGILLLALIILTIVISRTLKTIST